MITDPSGRALDYLRLSLTDRCNLRCVYCMPEEGVVWKPHAEILRFEESLRLCRILCALGIRRIKLTGGEPLVRRGLENFIRELREIPLLEELTLTTNGLLLAEFLDCLGDDARFLLNGVNISLNSPDAANFARIARRDRLGAALGGMRRALAAGLPVKLNCVPVRGFNERDLAATAALAKDEVRAVRFIELMPLGAGASLEGVPMAEVLAVLEGEFGPLRRDYSRIGNGPAVYYAVPGFAGKIGFISAISETFCAGCNRLRLGADGRLRACLASEISADLRSLLRSGAGDDEIKNAVLRLAASKPVSHRFAGPVAKGGRGGSGGLPGQEYCRIEDGMYRIGG
ncbi:MAG: GTP 3',8-cyclase MoaA [Spirochaetaceae bacterium]|jgi:cyclic pyranopterin phosphate synthase|nr:GTP 3',8-cyclase MoaA [Spirochaetaceae bacterium]